MPSNAFLLATMASFQIFALNCQRNQKEALKYECKSTPGLGASGDEELAHDSEKEGPHATVP